MTSARDAEGAEKGAGPLAGLRVLDLSRYIAGPYAGQILGHLGADVVKVEEPGSGDPMRNLSKYSSAAGSAHYLSGNASKRSMTLDLRAPEGREILLRLLQDCDVLIENFRPGVMDRLGLSHNRLTALNPRLVIASITGFGQTGPWRDWAAYDLIAQAIGGGMSLTGRPGEPPVKMGVPTGDLGASIYGVIGILAALMQRERTQAGDVVDVSMMDVQLSLLNYHAHYFWMSGEEPVPEGDGHPNIVPYQTFATLSGPMVVAVYGDPFWPGFCRAMGLDELEADPRFRINKLRLENKPALLPILAQRFASETREHWLERLLAEGVPVGPLHTVGEAVTSPQAMARGMTVTVAGPDGAPVNLLGQPLKFRTGRTEVALPPALGAQTDEVLANWAGCTPEEIANLHAAGVV